MVDKPLPILQNTLQNLSERQFLFGGPFCRYRQQSPSASETTSFRSDSQKKHFVR